VSAVQAAHYGAFVCRATNSMGSARAALQLVRRSRPESPSDLKSLATGPNSIQMAWTENFNGGMNNTLFKVQRHYDDGHRLVLCHYNLTGKF